MTTREDIYWCWRDRTPERRAEWEPFCEYRARERQAAEAFPDKREGFLDERY